MLKRILRRFGYMHMDEIKPLLLQAQEGGVMLGYTKMMSQIRSPQEAMLALAHQRGLNDNWRPN